MKNKTEEKKLIESYNWIREQTEIAIAKRAEETEFQGLNAELISIQSILLKLYDDTKPIKHPRDKGDSREEILRNFLCNYNLIPKKYGVSNCSTRVVSSSGHMSPELDIIFYDYLNSIVLKQHGETLRYYPIECVYGTIQVKSKLTKKSLKEGLDNIAQFKSITPTGTNITKIGNATLKQKLNGRFGILFAYEFELDWLKIIDEIKIYETTTPTHLLPNLIVILDKGYFVLGNENKYCLFQEDLEKLENPIVHGFPDSTGECLTCFYSNLIDLLERSTACMPDTQRYIDLPRTAGKHSYRLSFGLLSETLNCEKHGKYLIKFSEESISRILKIIVNIDPVNAAQAMDIAYGKKGDDTKSYEINPGKVKIYNPDEIATPDILINDDFTLKYMAINIKDQLIWLPYYYIVKHELILPCKECDKREKRNLKARETRERKKSELTAAKNALSKSEKK